MPGDIFISYARKDDQTAREVMGAKGLVTSLHDRLLAVFDELGTPRPTVFRDTQQIDKADQFEPRLGQALREAKLLVVVLSRNWLDSEWCRRELDTFVGHWQARQENEQQVKERIALVGKHAVPPDGRPGWLRGQSGYDLLDIGPENRGEIAYFDSDLGRPRDERWFGRIRELAEALRRRAHGGPTLPIPAASAPPLQPSRQTNGRTVFVARPASDMDQSCRTVVEELNRRGFRVRPEPGAALDTGDLAVQVIDEALAAADVSIHLLGDRSGPTPENSVPLVRLQLERAAVRIARSASGTADPRAFHRLLWAPRVMPDAADEAATRDPFAVLARQSGLVADTRPETAVLPGDKLDGDTLTKFRQFVVQHLDEIGRTAAARPPAVAAGAQVYIQHDERDAAAAETVAEGLERLGFAPLLPALEGDPAERQRVHRDALQTADAVLLCWAEAADVWVCAGASELRRWQDLGRSTAFTCRGVLALPPQRPAKERLRRFPPRTDLDGVIDATAAPQVTAETLDPLLRPLLASNP